MHFCLLRRSWVAGSIHFYMYHHSWVAASMHFCMPRRSWLAESTHCYVSRCSWAAGSIHFYVSHRSWVAEPTHFPAPRRFWAAASPHFHAPRRFGRLVLCISTRPGAPGCPNLYIFTCASAGSARGPSLRNESSQTAYFLSHFGTCLPLARNNILCIQFLRDKRAGCGILYLLMFFLR